MFPTLAEGRQLLCVVLWHGSGEALHDIAVEALLDLTALGLYRGDVRVDCAGWDVRFEDPVTVCDGVVS